MPTLIDQVSQHRQLIKYETLTLTLSEIVNMYKSHPQEIIINPDFQRLFRWSRESQSSFIESLILEIPIPPLFFYENPDGKWELLDGLQRVSTILKFLGTATDVPQEYQGEENNDAEWHYEHENDIEQPLQLLPAEYLTALAGMSFVRLPVALQLNLKRARVHVYVLKRETHPTYKFEVFKRLNRGGVELEPQELRNCAVRMLDARFPQFLQDIAKTETFVTALALSTEDVRNGYIEELALRYFTMKNYGQHFRHDVAGFLTSYMEQVARGAIAFNESDERFLFLRAWTCIANAAPDGEAFRARTQDNTRSVGPFSPSLFELISLAVAHHVDQVETKSPGDLRSSIFTLILSAREQSMTGAGSNSRVKTIGRIRMAQQWQP